MDWEGDGSSRDVMVEWSWEAAFHGPVHTATLAVATVLALFVLVLGSFGNGLVLTSAVQRRKKRSNFDLLLLNLSAADLVLCVVLAPLYLYTLFTDPPSPRIFCGCLLLAGTGLGLLSLLSIVAIAIHRQARVAGRAKRSLSARQTGVVLVVVWVVSWAGAVGATIHAMLGWRDSYDNCQFLIYSNDPLLHRFTLFFLGPVVVGSFVVIVVSYAVIARAVRAQSRARAQGLVALLRSPALVYRGAAVLKQSDLLVQERVVLGSLVRTKGTPVPQCRCCGCQAAAERESKAVTMCLVVMVTLVLCWSPLLVSQFIELATGPSIILLQVKLCGIALVLLNSALDPYMYAQTQSHARTRYGRLFWDVLRCQCTTSPRRTRFTATRTRPLVPLRSSLGEVDTPTLLPPDKGLEDRGGGERAGGGVIGRSKDTGRNVLSGSPELPDGVKVHGTALRQGVCSPGPGIDSVGVWQKGFSQQTLDIPACSANNSVRADIVTSPVVSNCRHICRTADVMCDVTTLGQKSWCPVHVPSDQNLMES